MFAISNAFFSLSSTAGIRTLRLPVIGRKAKMTCGSTPTSPHASFGSSLMSSSAGVGEEKPELKPWLFVGLGNPGKMYRGTRHNVGFDMVDAIADAEGISVSSPRFKALSGKGYIGDVPVILAKPQTFMNMYDDMDLPFSSLRMLSKGGHGGHNGMRSIIDRFKGSRDFLRLRIGIGRPPGKMEPASFVLKPFNKNEMQELDFTFQVGIEAVRLLTHEGFDKSATYVNSSK